MILLLAVRKAGKRAAFQSRQAVSLLCVRNCFDQKRHAARQIAHCLQALKNIQYWQLTLSKYPPTFFGLCDNAIKVSKKLVRHWLERSMLKDCAEEDIVKTVDYLADYHFHLQHNTRLTASELRENTALKIFDLEDDQEIQEAVLSLYHCYQIMAGATNVSKLIENHHQIKFVKNIVKV